MITLYENATHVIITGQPRELSELVDEFKFRPEGHFFALSYQRFKVSKGKEGWDGFVRPIQRINATSAKALRGHKEDIIKMSELLGLKLDLSHLLEYPFADMEIDDVRPDLVAGDFELDMNQRQCILEWLKAGIGFNKVTVGGGKTVIFAGAAALIKERYPEARFLYVTPSERLVRQVTREMRKFLPQFQIGQCGGGFHDFDAKDMVVCTVAMLNRHYHGLRTDEWFDTFMAILYDEVHHCFPAGTLVDGKPIETLKIGDLVLSADNYGQIEWKPVSMIYRTKAPMALVKISTEHGILICTANHPVFVSGRGYVPAVFVSTDDYAVNCTIQCRDNNEKTVPLSVPMLSVQKEVSWVANRKTEKDRKRFLLLSVCRSLSKVADEAVKSCLRFLWNAVFSHHTVTAQQGSRQSACLLHSCLWKRNGAKDFIRNDGAHQSQVCFSQNEDKKPYVSSRVTLESEAIFARLETKNKRRQWQADCTSSAAGGGAGLANGSAGENRVESCGRMALGLQIGRGQFGSQNCSRSGWERPCNGTRQNTGQEEGYFFETTRVDSVEILEFSSAEELRRVCSDGFVYNIEVEDNNNYFANGILVHNCGSKTSKKILMAIPAYFRLGASDTAKENDLVRYNDVRGLFGPILNDVGAAPLIDIGRLARPHIYVVDVPSWVGRFRDVPYRPEVGSKAYMLLDGDWVEGTYVSPVYELDENGKVKTKSVKSAEKDKEGEWIVEQEPIIVPGLHRLEIAGEEHEIDSRWCLLDRMYDRAIIRFKSRNEMIVDWVKYFHDRNWPTVVVATRTTHVYILEALLQAAVGDDNVRILVGEDSPGDRDDTFEWFKTTPGAVLVTPLVKEGVSINELRCMVVADHVADVEIARQLCGRAMRPKKGSDNRAHVVFFHDSQHPVLRRGCAQVFRQLELLDGYQFYSPCVGPETVDHLKKQ